MCPPRRAWQVRKKCMCVSNEVWTVWASNSEIIIIIGTEGICQGCPFSVIFIDCHRFALFSRIVAHLLPVISLPFIIRSAAALSCSGPRFSYKNFPLIKLDESFILMRHCWNVFCFSIISLASLTINYIRLPHINSINAPLDRVGNRGACKLTTPRVLVIAFIVCAICYGEIETCRIPHNNTA